MGPRKAAGRFGLALGMLALSIANGWAQEFRASLNGVVADAQGAVVPGVKITVSAGGHQGSVHDRVGAGWTV